MGELVEVVAGGAGWGLATGLVIGAVAGRGLRPVLEGAVRAGLAVGDRLGEWTAEMREQVDDVVAGATAEHAPAPTATGAVRQPTA